MRLTEYRSDILAVVAMVVGVFVGYDVFVRSERAPNLVITNWTVFRYDERVPQMFEKTPTVFQMGARDVTNPLVATFLVENDGRATIRPEDFIEPLAVSLPDGSENWIAACYNTNINVYAKWAVSSNRTVVLTPLLLNPGDECGLVIISTATNASFDQFKWSARIAGVTTIRQRSDLQYWMDKLGPRKYGTMFVIMGTKGVFLFLAFYVVLFSTAVTLWERSKGNRPSLRRRTSSIVVISVVTLVAAESIQSATIVGVSGQFLGSWVGLLIYVGLLVKWTYLAIRIRVQHGPAN